MMERFCNSIATVCIQLLFATAVLFFGTFAFAQSQTTTPESVTKSLRSKKDPVPWMNINAGVLFLSNENFRGATFYDYPFIFPGISFSFLKDRLTLRGPQLAYRYPISKKFRLFVQTGIVNDDALFEIFGKQKAIRSSRDTSLEMTLGVAYKMSRFFEVAGEFSQDLIAHHGQYGKLTLYLPALFIPSEEGPPWLIGKIFGATGVGSSKHNQYLYGSSASGGLGHLATGFEFVSPHGFYGITPVANLKYYRIIQSENRSAILVTDKPSGYALFLLLTYRLPV